MHTRLTPFGRAIRHWSLKLVGWAAGLTFATAAVGAAGRSTIPVVKAWWRHLGDSSTEALSPRTVQSITEALPRGSVTPPVYVLGNPLGESQQIYSPSWYPARSTAAPNWISQKTPMFSLLPPAPLEAGTKEQAVVQPQFLPKTQPVQADTKTRPPVAKPQEERQKNQERQHPAPAAPRAARETKHQASQDKASNRRKRK